MADFFETDEVTKGYDSRIAARILRYLKPYRTLVALVIVSLALSTVGELLIPVMIRKTIDEALLVSWYRVDASIVGDQGAGQNLRITEADPHLDGKIYLHSSRLKKLTKLETEALRDKGLFSPEEWYLVRVDPDDAAQMAVLTAHASLFQTGSAGDSGSGNSGNSSGSGDAREALRAGLPSGEKKVAAILLDNLKTLSEKDISILRKADKARIVTNITLLGGILLLVLASTFVMVWFSNLIGMKVMKDLRMQLFTHTTSRSMAFLSRQPVGRLVTRMSSDVETINQFFSDMLVAFIKDFSIMTGALAVLVALDARLALAVLALLPLVLFVANTARKKARDAFRRQRQWTSKVNAYIAERLAGVNVVKLFVREDASDREFQAQDRELMRANLGEMYVFATFRPAVDFLATLTTATALLVGSSLFLGYSLSLGTLIAFVNLIGLFYSPIKDLAEKYTMLQSAMAGGERIFTLLDATETIPDRPLRPMLSQVRGHIEFDHVWFAYKDEEWVLRNISFRIEPGQMVALVGYTGAGKTTIANLVTRFWDVQKGEIRIDGVPLRELPLPGLRKAIQPVPQDVFLFSGTIEDNIRMGTEVSIDRMKLAAAAVHADEFIDALPAGYATMLAEGASNLSQGQRQILSFARVLAHDPAVIILDEATSSVDTETEQLIRRGLEGLLRGRTSLVIAHRLSTIRHADRILVLAQGRLAESGTHDELIAAQGLYWNLYKLQYGGTE